MHRWLRFRTIRPWVFIGTVVLSFVGHARGDEDDIDPLVDCDDGVFDENNSTFIKFLGFLFVLGQFYCAVPLMIGGADAFPLLVLINAFMIFAVPLLVAPLTAFVDALNSEDADAQFAAGDLTALTTGMNYR